MSRPGQVDSQVPRGKAAFHALLLYLDGADPAEVSFVLPPDEWGGRWRRLLDTRNSAPDGDDGPVLSAGETIPIDGRAVVLLQRLQDG